MALRINAKIPSVRMVRGKVRIRSTGRRNTLNSPRMAAAIIAVFRESTWMPLKTLEATRMATVITSQRVKRRIIYLPLKIDFISLIGFIAGYGFLRLQEYPGHAEATHP